MGLGTNPGLAILTGLAQNMNAREERERQRKKDEILELMYRNQISTSNANMKLNRDREERIAKAGRLERSRVKADERDAEVERGRAEEQAQLDEGALVQDLMRQNKGMTEEEAVIRARTVMAGINQPDPRPAAAPREPSVTERRFEADQDKDRAKAELMTNERVTERLSRTPDVESAIALLPGVDPEVVSDVWESVYKDPDEVGRIDAAFLIGQSGENPCDAYDSYNAEYSALTEGSERFDLTVWEIRQMTTTLSLLRDACRKARGE